MSKKDVTERWVLTALGNIVEVHSGVGFPVQFQGKETGDYPVYKVRDVSMAVTQEKGRLSSAGHYINQDEVKLLKGKVFRIGTTLFAKIGEAVKLNRRAFVEQPGLADNNVMAVSSVKKEMDRFIFYFLNTIDLSEAARSTTVPSIRKSDIEEIPILLPSIAEQKIIADKLDDLLARVESIKTRLENIPEILKKFRQSVLSSIINKYSSDESSKERFSTTLGCISEDIRYGTSKKCSETEGNTAVLRIPNIGTGHIINSNLKYANFDERELSALSLKKGDLLLIRSNGSVDLVGKVAMVSEKDTEFLYAGYLIRIRLNLEMAAPEYVTYCLQSPQIRQVVENIARSTSGVNNINSKELSSLVLPIPPLAEQNEIIKDVDESLYCISLFETMTANALSRINNLTQSILAKAFRGELTAQWREENPELISGLNSAEALLEKITAEKLASGTIKKRAKKAPH